MKYEKDVDENWIIPKENFSDSYLESRLKNAPESDRAFLRSTLNYLYGKIKTLDRGRIITSKPYLTAAEKIVMRWLHTRSNGSERRNYGPNCVIVAKQAQYRCSLCKFPDVRVLQLDHINGRGTEVEKKFECLCANCHMIKSREKDWARPLSEE